MPTADLSAVFGLPPEEAIRYFEQKGYAIGFDWQDVWKQAQARAFTVAGVMKVDVLQDIRNSVSKMLREGKTLRDFQRELRPVLEAKGWWGKGLIVDEQTGEVKGKRLNPRRLETIFRTNAQSSFMAGRYQALMANVSDRPYWEYVPLLDERTRPAHAALSRRVYRYDDPFWQHFFPPNGWNCRCQVIAHSEADLKRLGLTVSRSEGQLQTFEQDIGRGGETRPATALEGLSGGMRFVADAGFDFNPGMEAMKPFTPPPLDDLPRTFTPGVPLPDLPEPAVVPASRLLPEDMGDADLAAAFLRRFGVEPGQSMVFTDKSGAPLVISESLFVNSSGEWKSSKNGRGPYMGLLADAVRDPDEIWLRWEQSRDTPDSWLLKRRYIKSWLIEGDDQPHYGLSVFEFGQDGWAGSTAMMSNEGRDVRHRLRYIQQQRDGFLLYRK